MQNVVQVPTRADSRIIVAAAIRLAGSADPVSIAEALGLGVMWAEPWRCLGARGAQLGKLLLVSEATPPNEVDTVVALLVGRALVDLWAIQTDAPDAFATAFAARLEAALLRAAA